MNKDKNTPLSKLAVPFVLLTIGITWVLWWTIVLANHYGYLKYGTPAMMLFYGFGGLAPALTAIVLLLKSKQMTKKELVKTIFNFKQPPLMYVAVILIAILSYIIPFIMNKITIIAPLYMIPLLLPFDLIGGGLEEIGWRFLFQPTLEKKTNFITATIITAAIWAPWHLPLFFMTGTFQSSWNFWVFAILALGLSFILAAIYRISKSVLLCILFHTLWNAIGESVAITMDLTTTIVISIALIIIASILIKLFPESR